MDQEKQKEVFEEKYEAKLDLTYEDWLLHAPKNEDEAYARCHEIDDELKESYERWFESEDTERDELSEERDRLKLEYDIIEELFGLELDDK